MRHVCVLLCVVCCVCTVRRGGGRGFYDVMQGFHGVIHGYGGEDELDGESVSR